MTLVWKDIQFARRDTQISDEAATFELCLVRLGQADFYDEVIFLSLKKDIYYVFIYLAARGLLVAAHSYLPS